jgi:hypothetical protein
VLYFPVQCSAFLRSIFCCPPFHILFSSSIIFCCPTFYILFSSSIFCFPPFNILLSATLNILPTPVKYSVNILLFSSAVFCSPHVKYSAVLRSIFCFPPVKYSAHFFPCLYYC